MSEADDEPNFIRGIFRGEVHVPLYAKPTHEEEEALTRYIEQLYGLTGFQRCCFGSERIYGPLSIEDQELPELP